MPCSKMLSAITAKKNKAMANFLKFISQGLHQIQRSFFPDLEYEAGPIPETLIKFSYILATIHSQKIPLPERCWTGRPPKSRRAIFNAFIAKSFLNMPTTLHLIERLHSDKHLRLVCGFESRGNIPSESVFSRVFSEFAQRCLPDQIHKTLIMQSFDQKIIGHISRDTTAIEARETPVKKENHPPRPKKRTGRKRPGDPPKELSRIQKQLNMTLEQMIQDLPIVCNRGSKRNSKGTVENWVGYKLHIDTADEGIPISAILTSASLNDSQVAIPLATMTANRVQNFYDLMDSSYCIKEVEEYSRKLGHIPLVDVNPRRNAALKNALESDEKARVALSWKPADAIRYAQRTTAERTNARLKDEFGGRTIRVRGHSKVFCHLMIGILILTADQLMRLMT